MREKLTAFVSTAAIAIGCLTAPAMAQTVAAGGAAASGERSDPNRLSDIVVTARRVSENVQRVPIAVTAYSGEELQRQNARTLPEVATLTPGLQFAPAQTNTAAVLIQMRGQVQQDTLATIDPSVGTYVDGVYWARAYGLTASLVDVANFQALKGPQGTLFGRNTTGGAILINTKDPSFADGLSGSLSGTYGRFNQQSLTGILNVPIVDNKIAARFAYSGNKRDGYVREVNSGRDIGNLNDYTIRGKLLITPTDTVRVVLSADKFHTNTFIDPGRLAYFSPNGNASFEAGLEALGAAGCLANRAACIGVGNNVLAQDVNRYGRSRYNASLSSTPHSTVTAQTYVATASVDTGFGQIKAIGGYRKTDSLILDSENDASSVEILDGSGTQKYGLFNRQKMQQWSGEVTATGKALDDKLDFALGGFLFHEYGNDDTPSSTFTQLSQLGTGGRRALTSFYGEVDNRGIGVYGQTTYHFTDKLGLTTGLRWSRDKRALSAQGGTYLLDPTGSRIQSFTCAFSQGCPFDRGTKFSGVAYTVSLDYQASPDTLVYLKTAKGFRSGGLVLRGIGAVPASLLPFAPETVYSYEGGLKKELFDRKLRVNIAVYRTRTKGAQRNTTVTSSAVANTVSTVTSNAGVVDIYGGELEMTALLGGGFQISGTAAYTKPKYKSFIDFNGFDRSHEPFQLTPRWTASVSPQWSGDVGSNKLSLRTDFVYQSSQFNYPQGFYKDANGVFRDAVSGAVTSAADVAGYNYATTDKKHILINANATMTILDGQLDLTLWGKNLSNLRDFVNTLPIPGLQQGRVMLREPRTFGGTATVRF